VPASYFLGVCRVSREFIEEFLECFFDELKVRWELLTALFLLMTRYTLRYPGWRGYLIGGFALVWISNQYMSIYNRLRLTIKSERVEVDTKEAASRKMRKVLDGPGARQRPSV
jgi:hypothetical protein